MDDTPSILIVDSNPGFAMMLKESLEQDDAYQALVAPSGDEALAAASQQRFDLAIVDLGIDAADGLDGKTVARRLRQEQPHIRLMLIPLEGEVLSEELEDLSVQGVLPKPFFLPDLPDLLDDALTAPFEAAEELAEAPEPAVEGPEPAVAAAPPDIATSLSPSVVRELEALVRELNADAVLVTRGGEVLGSAGRLDAEELDAVAHIVAQSCQLAGQAAEVLGRQQGRLEVNVEGDEHMLCSLTVSGDVLLSAVLRPDVTLGLLRHQARATVRRLRDLMRE
jgi:CheY-like chemotaxis protein